MDFVFSPIFSDSPHPWLSFQAYSGSLHPNSRRSRNCCRWYSNTLGAAPSIFVDYYGSNFATCVLFKLLSEFDIAIVSAFFLILVAGGGYRTIPVYREFQKESEHMHMGGLVKIFREIEAVICFCV